MPSSPHHQGYYTYNLDPKEVCMKFDNIVSSTQAHTPIDFYYMFQQVQNLIVTYL